MNAVPSVWAARRVRCLLAALGLLLPPAAATFAAPVCPASPSLAPITAPHLRTAISHGIEGVIVALGSSSTQGSMASDLAHSYPAVLQQTLSAGLPDSH